VELSQADAILVPVPQGRRLLVRRPSGGPSDDEAWQEFVSRVGKPISLMILRTASLWGEPSRTLVEDLVQVTYLKLWEGGCRLLRDFAVERPEAILGYLKKTAANATHDYFKHSRSQHAERAASCLH